MENRYPEEYFVHFMAMFNEQVSEENLSNHLHLAHAMEGFDYIKSLSEEFKTMVEHGDQDLFIKKAQTRNVKGFTQEHLEFLKSEVDLIIKEE